MSSKAAAISVLPPFLRQYLGRIEASRTGSRLVKGAFWSLSGSVANRVLAIASSFLVARMLGKQSFGALGVIQSTVGMFQVFAGFGLGVTATKYVAQYRTTDLGKVHRFVRSSTLIAAGTGSLMALVLVIIAPWLARTTLAAPELTGPLRLSALMLLLGAMIGAQLGTLSGFEAFKEIARITLIVGLATFPLMLAGVYFAGVTGGVAALAASMVVNWVLNHRALRSLLPAQDARGPQSSHAGELWVLWRFSTPAVLSGIMVAPVLWLCNAMLVNQPGGYGEMGIYNAANQWRTAVMFLPAVVENMILPVLSNLRGEGNWTAYRKVVLYNVYFNAGIALLVAMTIYAFSPLILKTYGPGFESGRPVLLVLALSAVLSATIGVSGQFIASEDRMWWGLFLNFIWAITLIIGTWFLVKKGALGLSLAYLLAYGVHLITSGCFVYYLLSKNHSLIPSSLQPVARASRP